MSEGTPGGGADLPTIFPKWAIWAAGGLAALIIVIFVIIGIEAFAPPSAPHPALATVERVLELRKARNRDAKAYAPYFAESSVATALADESKASTSTASPIPAWDKPYVGAEGSSTADVVVIWRRPAGFANFPKAVVFRTRLQSGRWVIVDASEVTGTIPPPVAGR